MAHSSVAFFVAPQEESSHSSSIEQLGDRIATLAAYLHAAEYHLLTLIREFDEREGWGESGFRSCAHWLSWRTGISLGPARERVRVARALADLPAIADAMRSGRLSFSKVRAVTRVATPDNESELLEFALTGTAAHVERLVRSWGRVDRIEAANNEQLRHERRGLNLWTDEDGSTRIEGTLDPEVGAMLRRALDAAGDAMFKDGTGGENERTPAQRQADALGLLAEWALAGRGKPARADRFQVMVHVEATELTGDAQSGGATLDDEVNVPAETFRRLSCDASRVDTVHASDGSTLSVGRRTRSVPPPIRRALRHRDKGCRFPGCAARFADAHHIQHWADGGETSLDNLVLLCRFHHRAVHEGGFDVNRSADGGFVFTRLDGVVVPAIPKRLEIEGSWDVDRKPWWRGGSDSGVMGPWTSASAWVGERFDVGLALDGLRTVGPIEQVAG